MAKKYETKVRIMDDGTVQVDDAKIRFKNFEGRPTKFNPKGGVRSFLWVIEDEEVADELKDMGFTGVKEYRNNDGDIVWQLDIKIRFNDKGPIIYMASRGKKIRLREEDDKALAKLDEVYISRFDFDFAPHGYDGRDGHTQTAYLRSAKATLFEYGSRFDDDDEEVDFDNDAAPF